MRNTDGNLWQRFKDGDRQAFLSLYDQYFPILFRYCKQITHNAEVIEDAIQDLFLSLWDRRSHLREAKSVKAYMMASVRRILLKQLKDNRLVELNHALEIPAFQPNESPQQLDLVQALEQLSEKQREVLFLKFYNNLSYREVAEVMDIPVDTVYKISKRSLKGLKKKLLASGFVLIAVMVSSFIR